MDQSVEQPEDQSEPIALAMWAFVQSPDWQEARTLVENNPELYLSDTVLAAFDESIPELQAHGKPEAAATFTRHRDVLLECRKHGIAATFEHLIASQSTRAALVQAIQAFLDTENWDAARAVVEEQQDLLLSDESLAIFDTNIENATTSNEPDFAAKLTMHRDVLLECRTNGIAAAFEQLAVSQSGPPPIIQAIQALLNADDLAEARATIDHHANLLLSDETIAIFDVNIEQGSTAGDVQAVASFTQLRDVLLACREHGIQTVFERLGAPEPEPPPAIVTFKRLLEAPSLDAAQAIIEEEQAVLLDDEALAMFATLIDHATAVGNAEGAYKFTQHRDVLVRCREDGIAATFATLVPNHFAEPPLIVAIKDFLNTENWQVAWDVVNQHQDLLLSDAALDVFEQTIAQASAANDPQSVANFTRHRDVLRDCRVHGIAATFEQLIADQPIPSPLTTAIDALLNTKHWADARAVVEQHQDVLLTDEAVAIFEQLIEQSETDNNPDAVHHFTVYRDTLLWCREDGIAPTFTALSLAPLVQQAIQALVGDVAEKQALYQTLEQHEPSNPDEQAFVAAIQQVLFGADVGTAGAALVPPFDTAWAAIIEGIQSRNGG